MVHKIDKTFSFKVKVGLSIEGVIDVKAVSFEDAYEKVKASGFIVVEQVSKDTTKPPIYR